MKQDSERIEISFYRLRGLASGVNSISVFEKLVKRGMTLVAIITVCGIMYPLFIALLR